MRVKAPFTGRAMLLWLFAAVVASLFALWDYVERDEPRPDSSPVTDFEVLSPPGSSR